MAFEGSMHILPILYSVGVMEVGDVLPMLVYAVPIIPVEHCEDDSVIYSMATP